ncbi:MAG TPA: hypothetical protein VFI84_01750 [Candidatus Saccharimonadales bacterium]|nr:hypothetical protein [Candidatus Saccharimonadales bacterium]
MEDAPSPFAEKIAYEPEDLGLDLDIREDLDIYTLASGDLVLAGHFVARREYERRHNAGLMDDEAYSLRLNDLDNRIQKRRQALGLQP